MNEQPKESKITVEITRTEWHEDHGMIGFGDRAMRLTARILDERRDAKQIEAREVRIARYEWDKAVEDDHVEKMKELVPVLRKHFPIAEEPKRELRMWEIFPDGDYDAGIDRLLKGEDE